jgi:hypothetical protein
MPKVGKIAMAPNQPAVNCTVVDYSAGGACLDLGGQLNVPQRIEFIYGNVRRKCRVVWKRGSRIGVAY